MLVPCNFLPFRAECKEAARRNISKGLSTVDSLITSLAIGNQVYRASWPAYTSIVTGRLWWNRGGSKGKSGYTFARCEADKAAIACRMGSYTAIGIRCWTNGFSSSFTATRACATTCRKRLNKCVSPLELPEEEWRSFDRGMHRLDRWWLHMKSWWG